MKKFLVILILLTLTIGVIYADDPDINQSGASGSSTALVDSVTSSTVVYVKGEANPGSGMDVTDVYRTGTTTGAIYLFYYTDYPPTDTNYASYTVVSISNFSYSSGDSTYTFQFTMPASIDTTYRAFQLFYGLVGNKDFTDYYGTRHTSYIDRGSFTHTTTPYTLDSNHKTYIKLFRDTVTEAPSITEPHDSEHDDNPTDVSFSLPEAGKDGTVQLIFKRSGERHICIVADESAGTHSFNIDPTALASASEIDSVSVLGDGASLTANVAYDVVIKYQDEAGNPADSVSISGYQYDTVTDQPSMDSPSNNAAVGEDFVVQYDMPEDAEASSVKITITRTAGNADAGSPHSAIISDETAGNNKQITLDTSNLGNTSNTTEISGWNSSSLVSGTTYSIKIEYKDFLGNTASAITHTGIDFSTGVVIHVDGTAIANSFSTGVDNQPIMRVDLWYTGTGSPHLTALEFDLTGTVTAGDFDSNAFKLWQSSSTNFDSTSATKLDSLDFADTANFTGLNIALETLSKAKKYFFLTADVASGADASHELGAQIDNTGRVTTDQGTVDGTNIPIQSGDQPLPVVLSSFTATFANNIPKLIWITYSETNNMSWNIYRAKSSNFGQAVRINGVSIEGQGTTTDMTMYAYKDQTGYDAGSTYYYWVESADYSGQTFLYEPVELNIPENDNPDSPNVAPTYGLYANYPNPFNPETQISFQISKNGRGKLSIFNQKGQRVKTLFNGYIDAKKMYYFNWDGTNASGKKVASGQYLYQLKVGSKVYTKKMTLVK